MKVAPVVFCLAIAACSQQGGTSAPSAASATAEERPATAAEITKAFVGHTIELNDGSLLTYTPEGRYTYKLTNTWTNMTATGKYLIEQGQVCVNFDGGARRCDSIVTNGSQMTLINAQGTRYKISPKS